MTLKGISFMIVVINKYLMFHPELDAFQFIALDRAFRPTLFIRILVNVGSKCNNAVINTG